MWCCMFGTKPSTRMDTRLPHVALVLCGTQSMGLVEVCWNLPRGKAEKYPLRDGSLHGCRVKYCSMRLFMAALP